MSNCHIKAVRPAVFIRRAGRRSEQLIRIDVSSEQGARRAKIIAESGGKLIGSQMYELRRGENALEFFIEEPKTACDALFSLRCDGAPPRAHSVRIAPPRHWTAHVVQLSHHDPGYTDLPSNVLACQRQNLIEAMEYAESTDAYPEDARFRIVVEQMWSLSHFLKTASREQHDRMIGLLRSGRFEMTALFGNMITEICGHETLIRTAYHSAELARRHGVPLVSAEHNDITGFSQGLSRVLTDIGVKIFCPGLPLYYGWGDKKYRSFWDEEEIFGCAGPGAFWWEAPTGRRVLFWSNNRGCGGDCRGTLPYLESGLEQLERDGYPYDVLRWPVIGGARDNSPYIRAYADTIRGWNEKWAWPRLICSTNALFYRDFIKCVPDDLPVRRGELPGQDYPSGATSTSIATAVNRRNHTALTDAEKLASAASLHTGCAWQKERVAEAYEASLWYDEHAWGYHFPAGPAARASEWEKALFAFRSEAFAAEVRDKAAARIADRLRLKAGEMYLVVFNLTSWPMTAPVSVPLREMDGTGSAMRWVPPEKDAAGAGYLKGVLLDSRFHVYPGREFLDGGFGLIDEATGERTAFCLSELKDAFEPADYAPQRLGLGGGTRRLGGFEDPVIIKYDIQFVARDVPAHGYKAYRLNAGGGFPEAPETPELAVSDYAIENEFYKITADSETLRITSVSDKRARRELADPAGGDFYRLIVRKGNAPDEIRETRTKLSTEKTVVSAAMSIEASALGHPSIRHRITLYAGVKNIYFETSVFKDPTPLLNAHMAFPLAAAEARFRYESALSIVEPARDYLPGAYSDIVAVQNWVVVQGGGHYALWSTLDAPMAGFCRLWPGYVSPAHRCYLDDSFIHDPQAAQDYAQNGWIFSQLYNNNFGTNFSVSQAGLAVFRYCLTSGEGAVSDPEAVRWGWQATAPQATMFTDRAAPDGSLPPCGQFLRADNPEVPVLNWKAAEDGGGHILRLWNVSGQPQTVNIRFEGYEVAEARLTDLVENDIPASTTATAVATVAPSAATPAPAAVSAFTPVASTSVPAASASVPATVSASVPAAASASVPAAISASEPATVSLARGGFAVSVGANEIANVRVTLKAL